MYHSNCTASYISHTEALRCNHVLQLVAVGTLERDPKSKVLCLGDPQLEVCSCTCMGPVKESCRST